MAKQIQFSSFNKVQKGRATGYSLEGTDMSTGQPWAQFIPSFQDNYSALKEKCITLKQGELFEPKLKKNDRGYWQLVDVTSFAGPKRSESTQTSDTSEHTESSVRLACATIASTIVCKMMEQGVGIKKTASPDVINSTIGSTACAIYDFVQNKALNTTIQSTMEDISPEGMPDEDNPWDDVPF